MAANRHFEKQANQLLAVGVLVFVFNMQLERVPEYYGGLSGVAKARYCTKVCGVGLKLGPYVILDELWMEETDRVPNVQWSDMFMYIIVTPSAYTKE